MSKVDPEKVVLSVNPFWYRRSPRALKPVLARIVEKLMCLDKLNCFLEHHEDCRGVEFIDALFKHFNFSYRVLGLGKEAIPSKGRLICVANHPLGVLEALAILRTIKEVRKDVRVVGNEIIMHVKQMKEMMLPYNVFSKTPQFSHIATIHRALQNEEVVIFFPSGVVSRLTFQGIRDGTWSNAVQGFIKQEQAPVLPIFVRGKNSLRFYLTSLLCRSYSTLRLFCEAFNKRHKFITLTIGELIPPSVFNLPMNEISKETKMLKEHVYALGRGEKIIKGPLSRS